jgi:hypothetical protein
MFAALSKSELLDEDSSPLLVEVLAITEYTPTPHSNDGTRTFKIQNLTMDPEGPGKDLGG